MTEKKSRKYIWLLIPAIFSLILLAAHFSRQNTNYLAIISLAIPLLLFIKKRWVIWLVQAALLAGTFEWVRSTFNYIQIRKEIDDDWTRLAIILFSVALITLISSLLLFRRKVLYRYPR